MSFLRKNILKNRRVDKNNVAEMDAGNDNDKYEVEPIYDYAIYVRKSKSGHLLGLYYLVF